MAYIKQSEPDPDALEEEIDLQDLLRIVEYITAAENSPTPLSFRAYMEDKGGSHKTLVALANAIEHKTGRLLFTRALLEEDGRRQRDTTTDYTKLDGVKSRRLQGQLTSYGRALGHLGRYIRDLVEYVLTSSQAPDDIKQFLFEEHHRLLERWGKPWSRIHEDARKKPRN